MERPPNHLPLQRADLWSFGALLFSWVAIVWAIDKQIGLSFGAILLAFSCDILDGVTARRNQPTHHGPVLDSQIDVLLYLVFPAITAYQSLGLHSIFGVGILTIFMGSGIYRLTRFTVQGFIATGSGRSYQGWPVFMHLPLLGILFTLRAIHAPGLATWSFAGFFLSSILMTLSFPFPKPMRMSVILIISIGLAAALFLKVFHF